MNGILEKSLGAISNEKIAARLTRGALIVCAALCVLLGPTYARAACGNLGGHGDISAVSMPPGMHSGASFRNPWDRPTIVGLWHVIYTAGGSTFNDTFDTWHADGTEVESAFISPASGNVCEGVWVPTGPRSVKLHHVGWVFNAATPTAVASNYFTLDEEVTVAEDNGSYSGKFTFKVWNLDGTPTPEVVAGTMASTRITVD